MRKTLLLLLFVFSILILKAEIIEKVYYFNDYKITNHGNYQTISFPNTLVTGLEGEPALPYCSVSLILPPGQSAESSGIFAKCKISGHFYRTFIYTVYERLFLWFIGLYTCQI